MGKSVNNEIMLITYADCMGNDLNDLENVLNKYLEIGRASCRERV